MLKPVIVIDWPLFALQDDGHVELFNDEINNFSGRGVVVDVQLHRGAAGQTSVIGGKNLRKKKCMKFFAQFD